VTAIALLSIALPIREAASGVSGAWRWAFDPRLTHLPFYQRVRGTYDLRETGRILPAMTLGYAILFGAPTLIGRFTRADRRQRMWHFIASFLAITSLLLICRDFIAWEEAGRPLIFVAVGCALFWVIRRYP